MAPLALVLVLATHVEARLSSDMTPWKGGGFGMFSTVDSPAGRVVQVELDTDIGLLPVAIPSPLRSRATAARAAPSHDRLVGLARVLGEQWWVVPDLASLAPADLLGDPGDPGDDDGVDLAAELATRAIAPDAVRAVEPAAFDEASQRRLTVRRITVTVLRPHAEARAEGATGSGDELVVVARPIREVTIDLVPPTREAGQ